MAAPIGTRISIGSILDELLSAAYTAFWARHALIGVSKISCVASRGINQLLKFFYFDTEKADTWAAKAVSFIPEPVRKIFSDDSGYNDFKREYKLDSTGRPEIEAGHYKYKLDKTQYEHSWQELLISGIGLSLMALVALEFKEAVWRPVHPFVNGILSYVSPIRFVLGQSWAAIGANSIRNAFITNTVPTYV